MPTGIRTPTSLPPPNRGGYADTYEETRARTPMEIGHDRVRQMHRSSPRLFTVQYQLTQQQYSDWDRWFQEILNGGEREFDTQLLDDTETLMWFTCRVVPATYQAFISEWNKWTVSLRLYSVAAPFADRAPGTDDLHGGAYGTTQAGGALAAYVVLGGAANATTAAGGALAVPFAGRAGMLPPVARGRLVTGLKGDAIIPATKAGGELD